MEQEPLFPKGDKVLPQKLKEKRERKEFEVVFFDGFTLVLRDSVFSGEITFRFDPKTEQIQEVSNTLSELKIEYPQRINKLFNQAFAAARRVFYSEEAKRRRRRTTMRRRQKSLLEG